MALLENFVKETSTTTGTGNFTLSSSTGFRQFSTAFATGGTDRFFYAIRHTGADEWEFGTGHLSDATTLVRDTVIDSSNSGSAVNFSAGDKDVLVDAPSSEQSLLPKGYIDPEGLTIANNSTDSDHDLDVTGGQLYVHDPGDRTNGNIVNVPDETAALAIDSTGEGGRINSSTLAADTWYEGAVLYDSGNDTVGFGLYKDADRPTSSADLPGTFDQFRAMGSPGKTWWVKTDGSSNILGFEMHSNGWRHFTADAMESLSISIFTDNSPATTTTEVGLSEFLPPATCDIHLRVRAQANSDGGFTSVRFANNDFSNSGSAFETGEFTFEQESADGQINAAIDNGTMRGIENQNLFYADNRGNSAQIILRAISSFRAV